MRNWLLLAVAAAAGLVVANSAHADQSMTRAELRLLFPGTYVAVFGNRLVVTFLAKENGELVGRTTERIDRGRWRLDDDKLCIMMPAWMGGRAACSELVSDNGWYRGQGVRFRKI